MTLDSSIRDRVFRKVDAPGCVARLLLEEKIIPNPSGTSKLSPAPSWRTEKPFFTSLVISIRDTTLTRLISCGTVNLGNVKLVRSSDGPPVQLFKMQVVETAMPARTRVRSSRPSN